MRYSDLYLEDDDLKIEESVACFVFDRMCIVQDLVNGLRDSHLLLEAVGERQPSEKSLLENKIKNFIELDTRIIPGSVVIYEDQTGLHVDAETRDLGKVEFYA